MHSLHKRSSVYTHNWCYVCRNFPRDLLHMQKFLGVVTFFCYKFSQKYVAYSVTDSKLDLLFPLYKDSAELPYFLGSEAGLFLLFKQIAEQGYPSMNTSKLNYIVITCIMLKQNSLTTCLPIYNATSQISSVTSKGYYGASGKYYSCYTTIHWLCL